MWQNYNYDVTETQARYCLSFAEYLKCYLIYTTGHFLSVPVVCGPARFCQLLKRHFIDAHKVNNFMKLHTRLARILNESGN